MPALLGFPGGPTPGYAGAGGFPQGGHAFPGAAGHPLAGGAGFHQGQCGCGGPSVPCQGDPRPFPQVLDEGDPRALGPGADVRACQGLGACRPGGEADALKTAAPGASAPPQVSSQCVQREIDRVERSFTQSLDEVRSWIVELQTSLGSQPDANS